MSGALAAYYRKIPVDHVEAGLRSGNIYHPWPEEVNRKMIGAMASLHFAQTETSAAALRRENVDPARVRVAYLDLKGKKREKELTDIWATLVQHEIDHLNGILFIDYLSRLKRDMVIKKFTKAKRAEAL